MFTTLLHSGCRSTSFIENDSVKTVGQKVRPFRQTRSILIISQLSLGLKYIDWEESIRNCLEHFVEKKEPGDGSESNVGGNESTAGGTIDLSKVGDTKVALRIEIERSIRVFKKMKDDAILDVNDIVFDKSLLSALPKNLVIEAIAAQLQTDEMCLKSKQPPVYIVYLILMVG